MICFFDLIAIQRRQPPGACAPHSEFIIPGTRRVSSSQTRMVRCTQGAFSSTRVERFQWTPPLSALRERML